VSRFQREAPLSPSSNNNASHAAPDPSQPAPTPPPLSLPDEIAHQLRKLFLGAKLPVPKELDAASASGDRRGGGGGRGRRRGGMIGAVEAERMLVEDLMGRDLRVDGPTPEQRRAAVRRWLRTGRVLVKGLRGPVEEAGALRQLEQVLVQEWDRAHLDVAATGAGGGGGGGAGAAAGGAAAPGGVQIVLDAEADMLQWQVLGDGRGHLLVVPAEDIKGSRYRLAAVLREIGQRALVARDVAAAAGAGGRMM
jgi:hypothetical protein